LHIHIAAELFDGL